MTFICIIGHFEDDDIGLQLPEFIEHFCFLIYICPSRWDLSNNSPNLHQKTTNWRILVVIVKWCHHSMYCPVAIIWGIFPVNTSQLIFNLNFFYYTGLYIIQTNSALHVYLFSVSLSFTLRADKSGPRFCFWPEQLSKSTCGKMHKTLLTT